MAGTRPPEQRDVRYSQATQVLPKDALVEHFITYGIERSIETGAGLRQKDDASLVHYVESGWIIREREMANGHYGIIGTYIPGDFIDLDCLVETAPVDLLTALTPVESRALPARTLAETIARDGSLAFPVMTRMTAESDWLREGLVAVGQLASVQRLMVYIWQTRRRMIAYGNQDPEAEQMPFPLTQAQIAAALGVSLVHANRTIQRLRKGHGVKLRSKQVLFDDVRKFEEAVAKLPD